MFQCCVRDSPPSTFDSSVTVVDKADGSDLFVLNNSKLPFFGEDPSFKTHKFSKELQNNWTDWDWKNLQPLPKSRRVPLSVYYPRFRNGRHQYTKAQLDTPYFVTKNWENYYQPYYLEDQDQYCENSCLWQAGFLERKCARIDAERRAYYIKMADMELSDKANSRINSFYDVFEVEQNGMTLYSPDPSPSDIMSEVEYYRLLTVALKKLLKVTGGVLTEIAPPPITSNEPSSLNKPDLEPDEEIEIGQNPVQQNAFEQEYTLPIGVDKNGEDFDFLDPSVGPPKAHYWTNVLFNDFYICRVYSPDNFYVQNRETLLDLEKLNAWMTEWYDEYWPAAPTLRCKDIVLQGFYAVYLERYAAWFRCSVDDFVQGDNESKDNEVVVLLLDYGSFEIVKLDCILPLRKIYCELPVRAAKAKLYVYADREWTPEEIQIFTDQMGGKQVQGIIMKQNIHRDENLNSLELILLTILENKECIFDLSGLLSFGYIDLSPPPTPARIVFNYPEPEVGILIDFD